MQQQQKKYFKYLNNLTLHIIGFMLSAITSLTVTLKQSCFTFIQTFSNHFLYFLSRSSFSTFEVKMFFLLQMSRWGILSPALLSSYPASVSISHRAASTGSWARITQEVRTNERVWSIFSYLPRWTCRSPASPKLSYSGFVSGFKRGFLLSLLSLKLRPKRQTLNNINNNIT